MAAARIDTLIWVLIYGGIGLACLGLALLKNDGSLGWAFSGVGGVMVVVGVLLIWVRSKYNDDDA